MNGGHDLGGMHGLGPIEPEQLEPIFHAEWERRAFALTLACGFLGQWSLDEARHARERQHPADYLRHSYYQNWLAGLETLLDEKGLVRADECAAGAKRHDVPADVEARRLSAERVGDVLARGGPVDMPSDSEPAFREGDPVQVINNHPLGHTRAPRYVRGRTGNIAAYRGFHVFPDASAQGERRGGHLYSVAFSGQELWGPGHPGNDRVFVDLWQAYLSTA